MLRQSSRKKWIKMKNKKAKVSFIESISRFICNDGYEEQYRLGLEEGSKCKSDEIEKIRKEAYDNGFADGKKEFNLQDAIASLYDPSKVVNEKPAYRDYARWLEQREEISYRKGLHDGYCKCVNDMKGSDKQDECFFVGDEVIADMGTAKFIITNMDGETVCGINEDGEAFEYYPSEICFKTGRHFDVKSWFSKKEGEENDENA